MSKMLADIKRIVDEDISNRVNQIDGILEAVTNPIHANATEINCYFSSSDNLINPDDSNIFVAFPFLYLDTGRLPSK